MHVCWIMIRPVGVGGRGFSHLWLCSYVPRDRVWFLKFSILKLMLAWFSRFYPWIECLHCKQKTNDLLLKLKYNKAIS